MTAGSAARRYANANACKITGSLHPGANLGLGGPRCEKTGLFSVLGVNSIGEPSPGAETFTFSGRQAGHLLTCALDTMYWWATPRQTTNRTSGPDQPATRGWLKAPWSKQKRLLPDLAWKRANRSWPVSGHKMIYLAGLTRVDRQILPGLNPEQDQWQSGPRKSNNELRVTARPARRALEENGEQVPGKPGETRATPNIQSQNFQPQRFQF